MKIAKKQRSTFTSNQDFQWNLVNSLYILQTIVVQNLNLIFLGNALALKNKKIQGIFKETYILTLSSSAVFGLQNHVSNFLICFAGEVKGFYQISTKNEIDFTDVMYISLNISAQDENFKKLRHFVDKRAVITTTLICSYHWKTLVLFCLRKTRPENIFLKLTLNCRRIIQKNNLCHAKKKQKKR